MNPADTFTLQPTRTLRQQRTRGLSRVALHFAEQNAIAAHIILANPDASGGEESLAVRWARLTVRTVEVVAA